MQPGSNRQPALAPLSLCVRALLGLFKLIDKVYRDAKAMPDAKEYVKRVVDNSTDRVPPNRLIIKQVGRHACALACTATLV
eukprot:1161408-Pelagomonas_calceolata.AAC.2